MKIKLLITALMFSASFVKAQNLFDVVYTNDKHIPAYLSIKEDVRLSLKMKSKSNSDALKGILHLNNETTAVLIDTLTDRTGGFHESYTEYYKGFKVDGTRCNTRSSGYVIPMPLMADMLSAKNEFNQVRQ